jgi:K+-sensing histidine kinase KdpD
MVSHELKGILSSTMLNACSVRDGYFGALNEAQARAMSSVVRNLDYFDMTVKNFLSLSRIEKDELSPVVTEVTLKEEVVDESASAFSRQARERHMTIENTVSPAMMVTADGPLLLMVMNNLIGNAVKYGAENGTIRIGANHLDTAVAVEVYNDGRPLTDKEEERLFRRFSRLDASPEARRTRGTGLGLFICRQIVERHGGGIRHESREKGNAFIFTLPVMPVSSDSKES